MRKELLRELPKIDYLLNEDIVKKYLQSINRDLIIEALREAIDFYRGEILNDRIDSLENIDILNYFDKLINEKTQNHFRKVINASGVIVHTNLGRSLLSEAASENVMQVMKHYNNLEYSIEEGSRGSRYDHLESLITKITGAEAALVVNNNAAAVMLTLSTLCNGKEAIVSRGQLVEIGGSFRVPDVMELSGAKLVEVGTTNKTHMYDYENNINTNTGVLMKIHTSNYKIMGFTKEITSEELLYLSNKYDLPTIEDLGSGALVDFSKYGFTYEPTVQESVKSGIDVITFSGDKMLGGPQAGFIIGKKKYIDKMKKNQLTRALRVGKMTIAAIEATLKLYLSEKEAIENIPTLNMMLTNKEIHKKRAQSLVRKLKKTTSSFTFKIEEDSSKVGGGSLPTETIPSYIIKSKNEKLSSSKIEALMRKNSTPIIGRVKEDAFVMDIRTVKDNDFNDIIKAFELIEKSIA
ncbi:L-seryl-tRNA(Sec) selenium transferase [Clostridium sediminicola]|uniref:L-seryl-tRNA(Sec) selenium transferase n=1 Tax=Clostridium sediminicola TaxID=3114879 RepID=UPI0031F1D81D